MAPENVTQKQLGFYWVQCDRCQEWRRLPGCTVEEYQVIQASKRWTCEMNRWDETQAQCATSEGVLLPVDCCPHSDSDGLMKAVKQRPPPNIPPHSHCRSERFGLCKNIYRQSDFLNYGVGKGTQEYSRRLRCAPEVLELSARCRGGSRRRSKGGLGAFGKELKDENNEKKRQSRRRISQRNKKDMKRVHLVQHNTKYSINSGTCSDRRYSDGMKTDQGSYGKEIKEEENGLCEPFNDCNTGDTSDGDDDESRRGEPGALRWAQCDVCEKWRCLPGCSEKDYNKLHNSDAPWRCSFNRWDASRADCSAPEERFKIVDHDASTVAVHEFNQYVDERLPKGNPLIGFPWNELPVVLLKRLLAATTTENMACCAEQPCTVELMRLQCQELLARFFLQKDSLLVHALQSVARFCLNEILDAPHQEEPAPQEEASSLYHTRLPEMSPKKCNDWMRNAFKSLMIVRENCSCDHQVDTQELEPLRDVDEKVNLRAALTAVVEDPLHSCSAVFELIRVFRPMLQSMVHASDTPPKASPLLSLLSTLQRDDLIQFIMDNSSTHLHSLLPKHNHIPVVLFDTNPCSSACHPLSGRVLIRSDAARVQAVSVFPNVVSLSCVNSANFCLFSKRSVVPLTNPLTDKSCSTKPQDSDRHMIYVDLAARVSWPGVVNLNTTLSEESGDDLYNDLSASASSDDTDPASSSVDPLSPAQIAFVRFWQHRRSDCTVRRLRTQLNRLSQRLMGPTRTGFTQSIDSTSDPMSAIPLRSSSCRHSFLLDPTQKKIHQGGSIAEYNAEQTPLQDVRAPCRASVPLDEGAPFQYVDPKEHTEARECHGLQGTDDVMEDAHETQLKRRKNGTKKKTSFKKLLAPSSLNQLVEHDILLELCILMTHLPKLLIFLHWGFEFFTNILTFHKPLYDKSEHPCEA